MKVNFFVKLQSPVMRTDGTSFEELRVTVDHYKGGYNYAYGNYEERGIKVFFTPIHRERNTYKVTLLGDIKESGFKMHVLDAKRKSQKKIDKVADAIKPLLDKFGEIWGQTDFNRTIYKMVIEAIANMPK